MTPQHFLKHPSFWLGLLLIITLFVPADRAWAQGGTAFTYQGRLSDGATPANGTYDFEFSLYSAETGGTQVGTTVTLNGISVSDGYFTVALDFGDVFNGTTMWLNINVRVGSSGTTFNPLSPRQKLTPTPYSLYSQSTGGLQGRAISKTAPTNGQMLAWDGSTWKPTTPITGSGVSSWNNLTNIPADLADGDADSLGKLVCSNNQIAKWNGTAWTCSADNSGSGSDTLGGLSCANGQVPKWNGSVWACSADNLGSDTLGGLSCANGQIAKWNGSTWSCAADNSGSGSDTLGGLSCANGQIAKWNGSAWSCAADNSGSGSDTLGGLSCANGQIAKWNGSAWSCAADNSGSGSDTLGGLSCANGQIAKWNGSAWACSADNNSGTITAVTGGTGLSGSGTSGAVNLSVAFAGDGAATTVARSDHNHLGETWTGSNNPLTVQGSFANTGALVVSNSATGGISNHGIYVTSVSGGSGVRVDSASEVGFGVLATKIGFAVNNATDVGFLVFNSATTGLQINSATNGVLVNSATNTGVFANSISTSDAGGYFINSSTNAGAPIIAAGSAVGGDIEFKVLRNGNVYADGSFNGGGADFAEMLPAVSGLEAGDVLAIGADGQMVRSTQANQPTVIGVYSTKPGFLGGAHDEADLTGKIPVAVVGVVPVKVTNQNGSIKPGDMLVASDTAGHAMKAGANPANGTVIGKALSGLTDASGVITMMVMLQ